MTSGKRTFPQFLSGSAILLLLLLSACSQAVQPQNATNTAKQVFVYPEQASTIDASEFDPAFAGGPIGPNLVYTGLVELDENNQLIDQLAQSHSLAADGVTWTFKLRPNLTFSDGSPLTSEDVIYSINRTLQPATKSPYGPTYLSLIKDEDKLQKGQIKTLINDSLLAPDPQTVVIITSHPAAYFLQTLTYTSSFTVNEKLAEKYGNQLYLHLNEGVGAGPFVVSQVTSQKITFAPNPHYYGPKPRLNKLVIVAYSDLNNMYNAYKAGQLSYSKVPSPDVAAAGSLPDNQFHLVPILGISYITMNYQIKPFDNIKVRQAFDLALNKQLIAQSAFHNTVIPSNHIIPQGMPGYNANLQGPAGVNSLSGDQAKAKQLFEQGLQEDGLTRAKLPNITIAVPDSLPEDAHALQVAQQMWQTVLGVKVAINDMGDSEFQKETAATTNNPKGLMMWDTYWKADYPDPQDWLTLLFEPGSYFNNENYALNHSAEVAEQKQNFAAMQKADTTMQQDQRIQQYNVTEQQVVNDVAWIPLYQMQTPKVIKPCVKNYPYQAPFLPAPNHWNNIYIDSGSCINANAG
ncbi:MAG TPA: peptide ABC transporter substrate-binding protein [Ktedonobacteraceae bacterium]|nr:peptide ABC transporter substrate-binding protein [Ktedonobacteraceae bacterium]